MRKGLLAGLAVALLTTLSGCFDCWDGMCDCYSCSDDWYDSWEHDWDDDWDDWDDCGCSSHIDYDSWSANHCWYDWYSDSVVCDSDWYDDNYSCSSDCSCGSHENHDSDRPNGGDVDNGHTDYARTCIRDSSCYTDEVCKDGYCVLQTIVEENPDIEVLPECTVNKDCSDDMICTDGRCIPCQTNVCDTSKEVECVFSSQCESGLCVDGVCLMPGNCAIDANCGDGYICFDGACIARPECLNDSECGDGKICNASNECEDDVECRVDSDCGEGLICVSNMCAQCRLNCECPNEGDVCMNGFCVADDRIMK
jgi:hypothetical protein